MTSLTLPIRRSRAQRGSRAQRAELPKTGARLTTDTLRMLWIPAVLGGLCLWLVLYGLVFSALFEHRSQHVLYAKFREELALATAPPVVRAAPGDPVALLSIPTLDMSRIVVVEGTRSGDLQAGPGHLPGSALPGQSGVSVLEGKSATYGAPFAHLDRLRSGAKIAFVTGQGTFSYHVIDVRSTGDPIPVTTAPKLVLASSFASGWRSGWAPSSAVYVDAVLDGTPVAPSVTGAASGADQVMASDSSALLPLFLWLLALAVVVAAVCVGAMRRMGRLAWLVGVPTGLACLWGATGALFGLLPNVI